MKKIIQPLNFCTVLSRNWVGQSLLTLMIALSSLAVTAQDYTLTKSITGLSESATQGHFNVHFELTLTNTNVPPFLTNLQIVDNVASTFGAAFIGVHQLPTIVSSSASTDPILNGAFSADGADPNIFNGVSGLLFNGEYVTVAFSVEIDASQANGPLTNNATGAGAIFGPVILPQPTASATLEDCWSDCTLACNNQVNISVNTMCEVDILADMLLEGDFDDCAESGFYSVEIYDANNNLLSLPLGGQYIGQKLKAVVTNIACGNSCWSNVLVEDKAPPVLNCDSDTVRCNADISPYNPAIGFPVDVMNILPTADPNTFIASSVDACGDVTLTYRDSLANRDCTDTVFSSVIYRTWKATDATGLMVSCVETIYFIRGTIADIVLPPHYDGQPGNEPYLQCDGDWCKLPNGFPAPEDCGTGAPMGVFCGNIQFDFYDDTIKICESSYKLIRTWLIIDWCDPQNRVEYDQRIKIVDEDGPVVIAPPRTPLVIPMDEWNCGKSSYIVPEPVFDPTGANAVNNPYVPTIVEECGTWTYSVEHLTVDENAKTAAECAVVDPNAIFSTGNVRKLRNGRYELYDIPAGCNWIKYIITDDCGNSTTFTFDIFIEDNIAPIAVCHEHTVVALTSDGKARVVAETFDDGSHDNCGLGDMQVRRMRSGDCPNGVIDDTRFRDYVEFCCEDIDDNPIMVVLRVWDECGNNFSECMVEVTVQDKLPPIITKVPDDVTINCEDDYEPLSQYGTIEAIDNCNVHIDVDDRINLSHCGTGTIERIFTATDDGGRSVTHTQVITVIDVDPFTVDDITWPVNQDLQNGCVSDTDPDNTGWPVFANDDDCTQLAMAYEDLVFSQVDGACLKILRQWRVIDWCQFDRSVPDQCYPINIGRWCHTQIIKVHDLDGPSFTSDCDDREYCTDNPGCSARIILEATAFDVCTPSDQLLWSYELDIDNDGSIDAAGSRNNFSRVYEVGTHRVVWTVEDRCGNAETCEYLFTVVDCKQPSPYCETGITTVLMPSTGEITLWASDFDAGSFDNCSDNEDLIFSFSADTSETNRTFTCDDIENGIADTIELVIYVTDEAGNQDFCITKLILQDNQDICPDKTTLNGMIAGLVATQGAETMKDVSVALSGAALGGELTFMTDDQGHFAFPDVPMHSSYQLRASHDIDPMNGISTLDLVLIQRHLLGYEQFDSPYKYIAADVNNSESISAGDIAELRKMILGLHADFPNNESWRFVDEDYQFPDPNDPFPFDEQVDIDDLRQDEMTSDFIAVKIGDISGDAEIGGANANQTRGGQFKVSTEIMMSMSGREVHVPIKVLDIESDAWLALQFTAEYDSEKMSFVRMQSGALALSDDNVAHIDAEGIITVSWGSVSAVELKRGEVLMTAVFEPVEDGNYGELKISSAITKALAYDINRFAYAVNGTNGVADVGFALHQNTPNPFRGSTTIGFELPGDLTYSIDIFDMSGKVLQTIQGQGVAGYQSVEVEMNKTSSSSVLYYQLKTETHSATRKMVIIE